MITDNFKQFAFIRSRSTKEFEVTVNRKMQELKHRKPEITFSESGDYMIARISYTESIMTPEDLADAYAMQNIKFTCQDCPMFKPIMNKDGTPNQRVRYGDCKYAKYGRTDKEARCCDTLYKLYRTGEVQLCLAKSE